jgi:hypothetical protein
VPNDHVISALGASYFRADRKGGGSRTVNLYPRVTADANEAQPFVLDSAPGQRRVLTLQGQVRGSHNADGRWFVVAGTGLYEISYTPADVLQVQFRGTVAGNEPVGMVHGRDQLCVVNGQQGYVLSLRGDNFNPINQAGWRGSYNVDHLDGYFVFVAPDTDQHYLSTIDDAGAIQAIDFSSADQSTDRLQVQVRFNGQMLFCGALSIEIWSNTGAPPPEYPLSRYSATPIEIGIVGRRAYAVTLDSFIFVGQTTRGVGGIYSFDGSQPQRISTDAVEQALLAPGVKLSECSTWSYHREGHEFVAFNAPGMNTTWVYDVATRLWHERALWVDGQHQPMQGKYVTLFAGKHYAIDGDAVCELTRDEPTVDGKNIVLERTFVISKQNLEPVQHRRLEVGCTTGNNGWLSLETSNDHGFRFDAALPVSLGETGRDGQVIAWHGLGTCKQRAYRLRCSGVAPMSIQKIVVNTS